MADACASQNACELILGSGIARAGAAAPAIIFGEQTISYGELERMVNRFGNALRSHGVGHGDRVLFLLRDGPDLVAGWLAAIKIGAVSVALNLRASAKDVRFAVDDSRCRALFYDEELALACQEALQVAVHAPEVIVAAGGIAAFVADGGDRLDTMPAVADDIAFWLYTSGTTGTPKGAMHRHAAAEIGDLHLCRNLGVRPGDRLFSSSKLFFAFALGHILIGGLRAGATLILYDGWPDGDAIARIVDRHRPDVMFSVPTFYRHLLRDGLAEAEAFGHVRHCVSAGEKLPEGLHRAWQEATGRPILEGIGTTETLFLMIAATPDAWHPGATGRPLPWVEARLEDEAGRPVATGEPGVLWVRMGSLARGYWNQPDKSAATFQDGWYRTGDLFSVDAEGWWHHQGRGDDMLKISGQWVSPAEIEEVAMTVPGITDAAVVGAVNAEGLVRLAMFLTPQDPAAAAEPLIGRVQEVIKARLSIYKCPRTVKVVEEMPRTATGKLQRFRLRQMLED